MADSNLPEAGARLTLSLDEWERNWSSVMGEAAELDSTINDLSGSVDIDFNITGDDALFEDIPESTETEVNVTESEDAKQAVADIHFMALKDKIETIWNIAGTAVDFVKNVGGAILDPFLEVDEAIARINAQTGSGTGLEDVGQFIRDIQAADLGDSVDQISDMVIHATQLGAPIKEATTASLQFTKVFDDQNPVTVMDTLKAASDEFEISITSAGDALTVFFQNGGNKGGDALAAVDKYSTSWKDMNLTFTEGLSLLHSLQEGGVDSADEAGRMIQTFDDAFTTAATNPDSQQAQFLKSIGMDNPKETGQAIGADTIDGFVSAFTTLPADQQDLASQLFFGKGGKLNTSAIANATTQDSIFQDYIGAAEDAATEIDNSLRGAIDDFILEVNTKFAELLSSDAIDLPGKIKALKEGLQEAVEVIASGGTIGEALEVGLNIPGFADGVNRFEASVGNFVISVLELIAGVQDFLNQDSSGTRRQIAQAERQQLPFNLKVANADEIAGELQTAIDRGLSTSDIATATGTALEEMIAGGDLDKAQALVDGLKEVQAGPPILAPDVSAVGRQEAQTALRTGDEQRIQEQLDKGNLIAPVSIDTEAFQAEIDDAQKQLEQSMLKFGPTLAKANPLGAFGAEQGAKTNPFLNMPDFGGDEPSNLFAGAISAFEDVMGKSDETKTTIETNTAAMTTAAQTADTGIATALTGNTVTTSFEDVAAAAESAFPSVVEWFQQTGAASAAFDAIVGVHLRSVTKQLADLNFLAQQVISNVTSAQQLGGSGVGAGVTNNTTNNSVTVNNNVNSSAAAAANGYAIGASLRPGGG